MKLTQLIRFGILASLSFLMAGCVADETGSDGSGKADGPRPCTVIYYDDAETPEQIGYSYVKPGASALTPRHYKEGGRYAEGYDYQTRKTTMPVADDNPNKPMTFVFSSFAGQYEDESPIDLYDIQADCNVYARFKKVAPSYRYVIRNGNKIATYLNELDQEVAYEKTAEFPDLPVLPANGILSDATTLQDETLSWFEEDDFAGYTLTYSKIVADETVEMQTGVIPSGASLKLIELGQPRPNADPEHQSYFWIDPAPQDGIYPFDVYYCDDSEWIALGSLIDGFALTFQAAYTDKVEKAFTAKIYESEAKAREGGEPLDTVSVQYLEKISASAPVANADKFDVTLTGGSAKTVTLAIEPTDWAGIYTGPGDFQGDEFRLKEAIQTDCSIYPIKEQKVHIYESEAKYLAAKAAKYTEMDDDKAGALEYPERMLVNYTAAIRYEIVNDVCVLSSSLGITRLRFDNPETNDPTKINGFVCYDSLNKTPGVDDPDFVIDRVGASLSAKNLFDSECYIYPTYEA